MAKFKLEILEKIKSDPDLFALVSRVSEIAPAALPMAIVRNSTKLNQYGVVVAVASHLGVDADDLLDKETVPQN